MRTTLTLDPDVAQLLEREAARRGTTLKQVVNDALRRGLAPAATPRASPGYRVRPHKTALQPGIDATSLNRLSDSLEDNDVIAKATRAR